MREQTRHEIFRSLVRSSEIESIRVLRMSADASNSGALQSADVSVDVGDRARWSLGGDRRVLRVEVDFQLVIRATENEDCRFSATVTYEVSYTFESAVPSDGAYDAALDLFARENGRYNAWPFLREFLNYATSHAGLPALLLPLLKPRAAKPLPELPERAEGDESAAN